MQTTNKPIKGAALGTSHDGRSFTYPSECGGVHTFTRNIEPEGDNRYEVFGTCAVCGPLRIFGWGCAPSTKHPRLELIKLHLENGTQLGDEDIRWLVAVADRIRDIAGAAPARNDVARLVLATLDHEVATAEIWRAR